MPARVKVLEIAHSRRSREICAAFVRGVKAHGYQVEHCLESDYTAPDTDIAVFYGLKGKLPQVMADYRAAGRPAVYVDLGYWGRVLSGQRFNGYHKISVNGRHPTSYFQRVQHPNDRILSLGIRPQPWRTGRKILLLGMSDKAAGVEGFAPEEWERKAIETLKQHTDRPIVYRPKPNWEGATPIDGAGYSPSKESLGEAFQDCHAVVTHHSNAAVEALVYGIPSFCMEGVATPLSLQDLSRIEAPYYPEGREQWIADIAYCQWSVSEIRRGMPWRQLKNEGLIE